MSVLPVRERFVVTLLLRDPCPSMLATLALLALRDWRPLYWLLFRNWRPLSKLSVREASRLSMLRGESDGLVGSGDDNGELAFNSGSCNMPERQRESTSAQRQG